MPRWSSRPRQSRAESQYVKGSPSNSVSPKPRSSQVMTRNSGLSAWTWGANISRSIKKPWESTTGGPSPPLSSKRSR